MCASPEEAGHNHCGMPLPPEMQSCPAGYYSDDCGGCYKWCTGNEHCPDSQTCNGSVCISPRECFVPGPTPV